MNFRLIAIAFILMLSAAPEAQEVFPQAPRDDNKLPIEIFYRDNCPECGRVRSDILPALKREFSETCDFRELSLADGDSYLILSAYLEHFEHKGNFPVYIVVGNSRLLAGRTAIETELRGTITAQLAMPRSDASPINQAQLKALLERRVRRFSIPAIAIAGMIDGINPCVFATLVFFISLLATTKVGGGKILAVGAVYCAACFITYFALGFGLLSFLGIMSATPMLRRMLDIATLLVLLVFAGISFGDAWRYQKTGKASSVVLQLPDRLKKYIHRIMRTGLTKSWMLGGVFATGVVVTMIESVCTGQVYVPTLVLLTRENGAGVWLFYLLLYNLAFVLPLLVVFYAAWCGTSVPQFIEWSKKHVVYSKVGLGIFFIGLAAAMVMIK